MDSRLNKVYEELLNQGISIVDLYIYDSIINNEYGYGCGDESIEQTFERIKDNYSNDYQCRDLAYHINAVLNGEEVDDEEWD
jgi:GGDEF domain-containing protein